MYQLNTGYIHITYCDTLHATAHMGIHTHTYQLHWTTKFNLFFGPRTSIGELSSNFNAEFRYVYRMFLSDRVSNIQRAVFVQISALRTNKTCRNILLYVEVYDFRR